MSEEIPDSDGHSVSQYGSFMMDPSLGKHILDTESGIDSLRLAFAGKDIDYQFDPPKLIKFGEPLMNEIGIGKFVSRLKSLNKTIIMSNFDKLTPYIFTKIQTYHIAREIFIHMDDYGIKNTDDGNMIIDMVMNIMFAIFQRAAGEGERKFFKGFTKESHVITQPKRSRLSLT